jgi:hypothetical protein
MAGLRHVILQQILSYRHENVHEPRAGTGESQHFFVQPKARQLVQPKPQQLVQPKPQQLVPPKLCRSAFMCFTDVKKNEILAASNVHEKGNVLKIVAKTWKALSGRERALWDEEARKDKLRYVFILLTWNMVGWNSQLSVTHTLIRCLRRYIREKSEYKGPWEQKKRRAKKNPLAPKRPMSAFLKYSQTRRAVVKRDNPELSNTDNSRLLGEMWRNASVVERAPYKEEEERERADYKERIKPWKDGEARLDAASRTSHRKVQKMVEYAPPARHAHDSFLDSNASFEPVRVQSVEDAVGKADQRMFRSSYSGYHQQSHRQWEDSFDYGGPLVPDSSIRTRHDYAEPEPFHPPRRQRQPTSQAEEDANRYNGRSPYFQDSAQTFNLYHFH